MQNYVPFHLFSNALKLKLWKKMEKIHAKINLLENYSVYLRSNGLWETQKKISVKHKQQFLGVL